MHRKGVKKPYRVRSFSFKTMRTLRGIRRSTSNTDSNTPSCCMTAFRMASFSSSVCGTMSIIPDARWREVSCPSSQLPFRANLPVMAASNTGYCHSHKKDTVGDKVIGRFTRSGPMFPTSWAYLRLSATVVGEAREINDNHSLQ